jgi:hypothetical protein
MTFENKIARRTFELKTEEARERENFTVRSFVICRYAL